MRRFFYDPCREQDDQILITGSEARHMTSVLRMQPGAKVELYDGRGGSVVGNIVKVSVQEVHIHILSRSMEPNPSRPLTLAQAMLKSKKMDMLVQKATELGVHRFIPVYARYCEKRTHNRRTAERWQRIMLEACKQCGRPLPMYIEPPIELLQLQPGVTGSRIIAWEDEQATPLSPGLLQNGAPCLLLIGPEGGFHDDELCHTQNQEFHSVSLGPRTLRAETAAIAAVSIIQYLSGNLVPAGGNQELTDQKIYS